MKASPIEFSILVVEDEQTWRSILRKHIYTSIKHNENQVVIEVASDFDSAYSLLQLRHWDLLITDIQLHGNGKKEGKELVKLSFSKEITTIVVSGTPIVSTQDVRNMIKKYKVDYFSKNNFNEQEFVALIRKIFSCQMKQGTGSIEHINHSSLNLEERDINSLSSIISRTAISSRLNPHVFFNRLILDDTLQGSKFSDIYDKWTGVANHDAKSLMDWAVTKVSSGNTEKTLLVEILNRLTKMVSSADLNTITSIIRRYNLSLNDEFTSGLLELSPAALYSDVRKKVFVSYSHKDRNWLLQLETHLKPLIRNNSISFWSDNQIKTGSNWFDEINSALAIAKVAVLLVTPNFLDSDFINNIELPSLLESEENNEPKIFWIPISYSLYEETVISKFKAAHPPEEPIDALNPSEQNRAWVNICKKIKAAFNS